MVDNSVISPNRLTTPIDPAYPSFTEFSILTHFKRRGSSGLSCVLVLAFVHPHALPGVAWSPFFAPSWPCPLASRDSAPRGPPSAQAPHSTRLSSLLPFLPLLSGRGAIASASAALVRGQKPAGCTQTPRHPGLCLSQPPVSLLRQH
jgi:hypothetical protein